MTVATSAGWVDRASSVVLTPMRWFEQARGRKRVALLVLYVVIAAAVAFFAWWGQTLRELPDVGDPFDVEAFQAGESFAGVRWDLQAAVGRSASTPWAWVQPEARDALEQSRVALSLWKQATDRERMVAVESLDRGTINDEDPLKDYGPALISLALLEGTRLEAEGQMDEAWVFYRATLRTHLHKERDAYRLWGRGYDPNILRSIARWAADPRVDAKLLRRALTEAQAIDAAIPSFADLLRAHYVSAMSLVGFAVDAATHPERRGAVWWYEFLPGYDHARRLVRREPERSRRILRLIYANLMAHVDLPPGQQPKLVAPGVFDVPVDPTGKDPARRISADDLLRHMAASMIPPYLWDRREVLVHNLPELEARASILIELASQLYRRERGEDPKSPNDLVGPYLHRLPPGSP